MIKIAIVGSREFKPLQQVDDYLNSVYKIMNLKNVYGISSDFKIITGGAPGVDRRAVDWCEREKVDYEVIRPLKPAEKISYLFRNIEIICKADFVVAFWDGKSRGTKFVIDYCLKREYPIKTFEKG